MVSAETPHAPDARPMAGDAITRDRRLHAAALRVLSGRPTDHAAECAGLALETCAAIDALREAVKPLQEFVTDIDRGDGRYGSTWQRQFYTLKRDRVHALLTALSALLGDDDA